MNSILLRIPLKTHGPLEKNIAYFVMIIGTCVPKVMMMAESEDPKPFIAFHEVSNESFV